jgi:hypothetical protein
MKESQVQIRLSTLRKGSAKNANAFITERDSRGWMDSGPSPIAIAINSALGNRDALFLCASPWLGLMRNACPKHTGASIMATSLMGQNAQKMMGLGVRWLGEEKGTRTVLKNGPRPAP